MRTLVVILVVVAAAVAVAFTVRVEYAPMPSESSIANPERAPGDTVYDVMGRRVSHAEAEALLATEEGRAYLSPANWAVRMDDGLRELGREVFYKETFGNEYFMSDVMGMAHGALSPFEVARAVVALGGRGTTNLQVRLAEDVTIGGRTLARGTLVDTGLDVPRGWFAPLGLKAVWDRGHLRIGATCALCHAAVDSETMQTIDGAPNADLAVGFMLALATNSAAYLGHVTIEDIARYVSEPARTVPTRDGGRAPLPDPAALERDVDTMLAAWAPGNFDSTPDAVNNPAQIPDSFTDMDHPFGWSGFAAIGPFRGSNVLSNNVHGLNADMTTVAEGAQTLFRMDPEVYLGALLQNAAEARFRYDPASGEAPSAFLRRVSPNPHGFGLVETQELPMFPKGAAIATHGLLASKPGHPVWRHISALSAFQDSLRPPRRAADDPAVLREGRRVFEAAGCQACHGGPAFSINRVLPAGAVGTQGSRAKALARQWLLLEPSTLFPADSEMPVPPGTAALPVPIAPEQETDLALAFAADGTGGYKTKGLIGLAVSAPYLHDGGVAVGPDPERDLGLPGTAYRHVPADPANSLRALLDRRLRARVVAANRVFAPAVMTHNSGEGHAFWADGEAGFTAREQQALIAYLLSLTELQ